MIMVTASSVDCHPLYYIRQSKPLDLDIGNEDLMEDIDFALARFYRQGGNYRTSLRAERKFLNHCNEATHSFGRVLLEREYGTGDQSFFEAHNAEYFDLRSDGPFHRDYGDFHSIGLIVVPQENHFLAIDFTHNMVDNLDERRAALFYTRNILTLLQKLNEYYGGRWQAEFMFNHVLNQYLWLDGKTIEDFISVG